MNIDRSEICTDIVTLNKLAAEENFVSMPLMLPPDVINSNWQISYNDDLVLDTVNGVESDEIGFLGIVEAYSNSKDPEKGWIVHYENAKDASLVIKYGKVEIKRIKNV